MKSHEGHILMLLGIALMLCTHIVAQTDSTTTTPADTLASKERTIVVADMEMHTPLRGVLVFLPNRESVRTNYRGEFVLRTDTFSILRLRHPKYHELKLTPEELAQTDTVLLLPRENTLGEVVVYGHRKDMQSKLNAMHDMLNAQMIEEMRALADKPGVDFDFGELTDFKGRARKKRKERIKRSLEKY